MPAIAVAALPYGSRPLVELLVVAVAAVLLWAVGRVAYRLWLRRTLARRMTEGRPHTRAEVDETLRQALPLWGRVGPPDRELPDDPFVLTVPVTVAPFGDGRPGERFLAPGEPHRQPELGVDGSRQDAALRIAPGAFLLVVCFGRVGVAYRGRVLRPAEGRPDHALASLAEGSTPLGPVSVVDTAAGRGWRLSFRVGNAVVTDTHLDHRGWGFAVGVVRRAGPQDTGAADVTGGAAGPGGQEPAGPLDLVGPPDRPDQRHLAALADAVLATWQWLDDTDYPPPVAPDLPDDPLAGSVVVRVGGGDRPGAEFRAAAPDCGPAPGARVGRDGSTTEAVVRLSTTSELLVVSAPLAAGAAGAADAAGRTVGAAGRTAAAEQRALGEAFLPAGPATTIDTPAGPAVRRGYTVPWGSGRHVVELDHGGRAWTLVLTHGPYEASLVGALDGALATWQWDDEPATAAGRP